MSAPAHSRTIVVSPHLDDAVLSLGAWLANIARNGEQVEVVTVFGGDPNSDLPAGEWDRLCGFSTAGAAARARREEDRRACEILGIHGECLAFADQQYGDHDADLIWSSLHPKLANAGRMLLPGFPLAHPDHRWLANLVTDRLAEHGPIGRYLEHPYASNSGGAPGSWTRVPSGRRDRSAKRQACAQYASQMRMLRGHVIRMQIREALRSIEWVRWVP